MPFVAIGGCRLEYEWIAETRPGVPTLVFLHEGLGSVALWRDFPAKLAAATGAAALVYSRRGYGSSDALEAPHAVDYMHREALEVLPALLDRFAIAAPVLVGHSDGASIALIHAGGAGRDVRGLVLEAPHVFVEDVTIASIAAAKASYAASGLGRRLAPYHADPDAAFRGWNDIWLDPEFRAWNIEAYLPAIACPVLAIQGEEDEYGTVAQLHAIRRGVAGPCELLLLPGCRHSPHRDQAEATLQAMVRFIGGLG
ncbi:MAG TPA: alpha/beta hydrolase [Stellaceae bacterium]|nr:alpha/beta hydrolase [Stellaceae bacterium]